MALRIEDVNIVSGIVPVDLSSGANDGDWINLHLYGSVMIVFFKAAGTAGQDPTLTLEQAKDVAGLDAKGLNLDTIHTKQGTLTSVGTYTKITQTAASTYTDLTSAEVEAIWVVMVDTPSLDINNGFKTMRARVADVGANPQVGCLLYLVNQPRLRKDILDSAIVD